VPWRCNRVTDCGRRYSASASRSSSLGWFEDFTAGRGGVTSWRFSRVAGTAGDSPHCYTYILHVCWARGRTQTGCQRPPGLRLSPIPSRHSHRLRKTFLPRHAFLRSFHCVPCMVATSWLHSNYPYRTYRRSGTCRLGTCLPGTAFAARQHSNILQDDFLLCWPGRRRCATRMATTYHLIQTSLK